MVAAVAQSRGIWQIAGGPTNRPFADVFLKFGVGLIGPGDTGPWSEERYAHDFALAGFVRRFATEVKPGEVFLLRSGIATICAVGIVDGEYQYLEQFDDVNGWDLQHARRVHWCRLPQEHTFDTQVFGASPTRCSRVSNAEVINYANRFLNSPPTHWQTAVLPELPLEEPLLEQVPVEFQELVATASDLVPLMWDRQAFGEHPTEDELIGHFVIPFLRSLGWHQEYIAVKWRYIDVSVFRTLPRTPENCHFLIEAKRLGAGVEGALEQAKRYVDALGAPKDVVVTDGIRYRMYSCQNNFEPVAYANFCRLKQSATELFTRMRRP